MKARVLAGRWRRRGLGLATVATIAVIATVFAATGNATSTQEKYTIGVSNTLVGNGWREGMICSIKAQALKSGQVSDLRIAHRQTDTAGQIADIRTMISAGVNAIIINPSNANALKPIAQQARARGITVVFIDQYVNAPGVYNATNDQVAYGRLGAEWLFEQLGGSGNVAYMRGIDGVPADTDRDQGFQEALGSYPDITIAAETFTGWDFSKGGQQALNLLNSKDVDGIWTSGIDYTVVDAFETANHPPVPVVGADNNQFLNQMIEMYPDFVGAAVTNPATIGGVGTAIALDVLEGEEVDRETLLTPEVWDMENTPDEVESHYFADRDPTYSVQVTVDPYTSYTPEQLFDCKGPGE
jgi:ribose transport system substrate-binding protein